MRDGGDGQALPRAARITASDELRALLGRGKRRKTRHLDVFVSGSPVAHSRLGVVVAKPRQKPPAKGKRIPAAAVRRNRLKRRLREVGRTGLLPTLNQAGCFADVLIRARQEAYDATFAALRAEVEGLAEWICSSER